MTQDKKLILLTNDDGIDAPGILAIRKHLLKVADCVVVAPAVECSASSHSVTLRENILLEKYSRGEEWLGYRVWGKPADCVKLALCELLDKKPDLIVAGINNGPNLGVSIFYSGTVAAAREGAMSSIPSLALSVSGREIVDYEGASKIGLKLVEYLLANHLPKRTFLNVNIPNLPKEEIKGFRLTRQADSYFEEKFQKLEASREGRTAFSLAGEMIVLTEHKDNDVDAVLEGYVSVTPLQMDSTDETFRVQMENNFNLD